MSNKLKVARLLPLFLCLVAFLDIRGGRVNVAGLSFYWTTARIGIFLFCMATMFWFFQAGLPRLYKINRSIFLASLVFLSIAFISALTGIHAANSLEQWFYYAAYFYIFLFFLAFPEAVIHAHIPTCLFILGIALAVLGIAEHFSKSLWLFLFEAFRPMTGGNFEGRSLATLQNPTTLGALLVVCYVAGWLIRGKIKWLIFLGAEALIFLAVLFSQSRIATLLFLIAFCFRIFSDLKIQERSHWRIGFFISACLLLFLIIVASPRLRELALEIPTSLFSWGRLDKLLSYRLTLWQASLKIWLEHKLFGVGLGNAALAAIPLVPFYIPGTAHPHNLFLRVLCETGAIGFCFFSLLCWRVGKEVFKRGIKPAAYPLLCFLAVELFEELTREAFPGVVLALATVYALMTDLPHKVTLNNSHPVLLGKR